MEELKRGDKIYLDRERTVESAVNPFLACRDGIVEAYEYVDTSGYGSRVKLFLCRDSKQEVTSIVRQTFNEIRGEWREDEMFFDSDSFYFLKGLILGKKDVFGGDFTTVRDYTQGD